MKYHVRSEKIRIELGVAQIRGKVKDYDGLGMSREVAVTSKQFMKGKRSRDRHQIRWSDWLPKDLHERKLQEEDAMDRERQRNKIKIPDPQISCS